MHSDIKVTDGVYSILTGEEIFERMNSLTDKVGIDKRKDEIINYLEEILNELKM